MEKKNNSSEISKQNVFIQYVNNSLERISKTFAAYYKDDYELTTKQMSTLWYLKYEGMMTMSQFADKMQMSRQQASQLIAHLVDKGYVQRKYSKMNRRITNIVISDEGNTIVEAVQERFCVHAMQEINGLSKPDQERFLSALMVMNELLPQLDFGPDKK